MNFLKSYSDAARRLLLLWHQNIIWLSRGAARRRRQQVFEQMYEMGNRSVLFITVTLGVLGIITVFQSLHQV